MVILAVAPVSDSVTEYSANWLELLFAELGPQTHVDLSRRDAVRASFEDAVRLHAPEMVAFYDHGSEDALWGSDGRTILDYSNSHLMAGREVYTMACLAARKLGPKAYREGCKAWWGYLEPYSFVTDDEAVFGKLANRGLLLRLGRGLSWEDCVREVRSEYDLAIENMRAKPGAGWTVIALVNDRDCLVCYTDLSQPPSDCPWRNLGISVFGRAGQKMSKTAAVTMSLLFVSLTVVLFRFMEAVQDAYGSPLVPDLGYAGLAGMVVCTVALTGEYMRTLDQR